MKKKSYLIIAIIIEVTYFFIIIPSLFNKYIPFNGPSINKFLVYKSYIKYLDSNNLLLKLISEALAWATIGTIITMVVLYIINKLITRLGNNNRG